MQLPKAFTHSLMFLIGTGVVMYTLWLTIPPSTQVSEASQKQPVIDKNQALSQNDLFQIIDVTPKMQLILKGKPGEHKINDKRFEALDMQKHSKLKDFFIGRFVRVTQTANLEIDLPIELYHPVCFSDNVADSEFKNQCPLVLQP